MKTLALAFVLLICLALPASAVDARATWNSLAASYNFGQVNESITFAQCWSPQSFPASFEADFAAIKSAIAGTMGGPINDPNGDDLMSALANW
jgi:hypothetical protein